MPGYHGIATADGYSRSRRLTAALKKGQKVLVMVSNIILNIWYMYMSGFPIHVYVYVYTCVYMHNTHIHVYMYMMIHTYMHINMYITYT